MATMEPHLSFDETELLAAMRQFCTVVEADTSGVVHAYLAVIQHHLALLYAAATQLPDCAPETEQLLIAGIDTSAGIAAIRSMLRDIPAHYWDVYDPLETNQPEPVEGLLDVAMTEVYEDVKQAIAYSQMEASRADVLWQWRFDFRSHWGRHALEALRVIHHHLYHL